MATVEKTASSSMRSPARGRLQWRRLVMLAVFLWVKLAQGASGPPVILSQPSSQAVSSGDSVSFQVLADGSTPLSYRWFVNGQPRNNPSNTFTINLVVFTNAGTYQVVVTNLLGAVTSQVARLTVDEDLTFRLLNLTTNGLAAVEENVLTGYPRGGLAVSSNYVLATGGGSSGNYPATARYGLGNLAGGSLLPTGFDALVCNLRSGKVYTLAYNTTPISYANGYLNYSSFNALLEIDDNGNLTGNGIALSRSISITYPYYTGLFSGCDRVVIHGLANGRIYNIALPSGLVSDLGVFATPLHNGGNSWAYWGIAEYVNGYISLVYAQDSTTIARRQIPGGRVTALNGFSNLGPMATLGFSPGQSRWYFHVPGSSQFGSFSSVLGTAKATFTTDTDYPVFTMEPWPQKADIGSNALFTSALSGAEPFWYQWLFNGAPIPEATNASLLLTNVQLTDAGFYSLQVFNPVGFARSAEAFLDVVTAPRILSVPAGRSVMQGSNTVLAFNVDGAPPLTLEWRFNGSPLPVTTSNATLVLNNIQPSQSGFYSVLVSNRFGTALSGEVEVFVSAPLDDGSAFQIAALQASPYNVIETYNLFGFYECNPIAVTTNSVFFSAGSSTYGVSYRSARANSSDLGGLSLISRYYFALISNLRNERAYVLGPAGGPLTSDGSFTATGMWELDSTTGALGSRTDLSQPVPDIDGMNAAFFAGYNRAVVLNGSRAYSIALPSGVVTDLGLMSLPAHSYDPFNNTFWGVAENAGGFTYLVFARNSSSIGRIRVPDGMSFGAFPFSNLSEYMNSVSVSISRGRWYFQNLIGSQFTSSFLSSLGYAPATFNIDSGTNVDHFEWAPIASPQLAFEPFPVTILAKNTAGDTISNFNGTVYLSGAAYPSGSPISFTPNAIMFLNGAWSSTVTVLQATTNMYFQADDRDGRRGRSGYFRVNPRNDLGITMSASPNPVVVGELLTYSIRLTNTGPLAVTGVTVTNPLTSTLNFISATPSQGSCSNASGTVICDLGAVSNAVDISIVVQPTRTGIILSRVSFGRNGTDPDPANNSVTVITSVVLPILRVQDTSLVEANSGTNSMTFTVTLNPAPTNTVSVNYATGNGTAFSSGAYPDFVAGSGTLIFPPGSTSQTFTVGIRGDLVFEADETLVVNLTSPTNGYIGRVQGTGTILNDDSPPEINISDASLLEGDSGTNNALFTVTLSTMTGAEVTFGYASSNGTASAGSDYLARSGVLNFASETTNLVRSISVPVLSDTQPELDEDFYLVLTGLTNAAAGKTNGLGAIINDDGIGVLDHFTWSTIVSPQSVDTPFLASITAKDFFETTLSNFTGPVNLSAVVPQPSLSGMILGDLPPEFTYTGGVYTIGYFFTPTNDLLVTQVRSFSGSKVSIWNDAGTLLSVQSVTNLPGAWSSTPMDSPLQLLAGRTYCVGFYTGGNVEPVRAWTFSYSTNFPNGTIGMCVFTPEDGFPTNDVGGGALFLVDLIYEVPQPPVAISMNRTVSGIFADGAWSGELSVGQAATNVVLQADDGAGHRNRSNPFEVTDLPLILVPPQDQSVNSGATVQFTVQASGAPPLFYQWLCNGTNIAGATGATLVLSNVTMFNYGVYTVVVSNQYGAVVSPPAQLRIDDQLTFHILELRTNSLIVLNEQPLTGYGKGGIGVSSNYVLVTGRGTTGYGSVSARHALLDLSGGVRTGTGLDALAYNLRSGKIYNLGNGSSPITYVNYSLNSYSVNSLLEIDETTGAPTGTRINLSQSIPITTYLWNGIFSGVDRIVVQGAWSGDGYHIYDIALPSGQVTDHGVMDIPWTTYSYNWAYSGLVEYFGGSLYLVYAQNEYTIVRRRVPDGAISTVASFSYLGYYMSTLGFSLPASRWFFSIPYESQFSTYVNTLGSAKAAYTTNPDYPAIVAQPFWQSVYVESNALFQVSVAGAPPFSYQWLFNGSSIPDATNATLLLTNVQPEDGGYYSVLVGNYVGSVESDAAWLDVISYPYIIYEPVDMNSFVGSNATFWVIADGAPPLSYQWFFNGANIPSATNSTLLLTNLLLSQAGGYSVTVSNRFGSVTSPTATLFIIVVNDDGSIFRVDLQTSNPRIIGQGGMGGDDRGGIGASSRYLFYSADERTIRVSLDDLSGLTTVGTFNYDSLASNFRTETAYLLATGSSPIQGTSFEGMLDNLLELNSDGSLSGRSIPLSRAIPVGGDYGYRQTGIFSGYNRIVIHNRTNIFNLALPSGEVTVLGAMSEPYHANTENWAYWGVAEHFGGLVYLNYVQDNRTIVRTRVPDSLITTNASFTGLSDMACFTVSAARQRWYFHYEYQGQFGGDSGGGNETLGYADATITVFNPNADHFDWRPIASPQRTGTPFAATVFAKNTGNQIATNFNGTATLRGYNSPSGTTVLILPTSPVPFTNGIWSGLITVFQASTNMHLRAEDAQGNNGNSSPFLVQPGNDLMVFMTDAPDPVVVGQLLTYSILVSNTGPSTLSGVMLTNPLSTNVLFVSVTPSQGACANEAGVVLCQLGTVTNSVEVALLVQPLRVGLLTNQASVGRSGVDPNLSNNLATVVTTVALPLLSISDVNGAEGNSNSTPFIFAVTLSPPSSNAVTVNYALASGTATAGSDFTGGSGTVVFPPGATNQPVSVAVLGDLVFEADETFTVNLSNPTNGTILDGQGIGAILNDDNPPTVSITGGGSITEGNSGTNNVTFTISVSVSSGVDVIVGYATSNGTAAAGLDYLPRSGAFTFSAGSSLLTRTVSVPVLGDTIPEPNETFYLALAYLSNAVPGQASAVCTIVNNDGLGVLDRFTWRAFGATQRVSQPFTVTAFAKDVSGGTVTSFTNTVNLSGLLLSRITNSILDNLGPQLGAVGDWTLGYSFTPNRDLQVTHLRSFFGSKMSIWTDSGALLATQPITSPPGSWSETLLQPSITLAAGTRYRLAAYTGGANYSGSLSGSTNFADGSIEQSYQCAGDNFPTNADTYRWWLVDLGYTVESNTVVPLTPTLSGNFVRGAWTGAVMVAQIANDMVLQADDGAQHRGRSSPFNVWLEDVDLGLTVSCAPNPAPLGSNVTFALQVTNQGPVAARNLVLSNQLPAGMSFVSAFAGAWTWTNSGNLVIARLNTLSAGSGTVFTLTASAEVAGTNLNYTSILCDNPDVNPADNLAVLPIVITAPANEARFTYARVSGSDFQIGFHGAQGATYMLERADCLPSTNWAPIIEFRIGPTRDIDLFDSIITNTPAQFYRIRLVPEP